MRHMHGLSPTRTMEAPLSPCWPVQRSLDIKFSVPTSVARHAVVDYLSATYFAQGDSADAVTRSESIPLFEKDPSLLSNQRQQETEPSCQTKLIHSKCLSPREFITWKPTAVATQLVPSTLLHSVFPEAIKFENTHPDLVRLRLTAGERNSLTRLQSAHKEKEWKTLVVQVGLYPCLGGMHPVKLQSLAEIIINACDKAATGCITVLIRCLRAAQGYPDALPKKLRVHLKKYLSLQREQRQYVAMLYLKRKFRVSEEVMPCRFAPISAESSTYHGFLDENGAISERTVEGLDVAFFLLSGDTDDDGSYYFIQKLILQRASVGKLPLQHKMMLRLFSKHHRLTRFQKEASHWFSSLASAIESGDDSSIKHISSKAILLPGHKRNGFGPSSSPSNRINPALATDVRWKPRVLRVIKEWRQYSSLDRDHPPTKKYLTSFEAEQQVMNPIVTYMKGISLLASYFERARNNKSSLISATQLYKFLLKQDPSSNTSVRSSYGAGVGSGPNRGQWWYRLAVTTSDASRSKPMALRICEQALQQDCWVRGTYEIILRQKYKQLQDAIERDRRDPGNDHGRGENSGCSPFRPVQYGHLVGHLRTHKLKKSVKQHDRQENVNRDRFVDPDNSRINVEEFVLSTFLHVKEPNEIMALESSRGKNSESARDCCSIFPESAIVRAARAFYVTFKSNVVHRQQSTTVFSPFPALTLCNARLLGRLGWRGLHSENSLWRTLFTLLCWDEIFGTTSLFHNCFQQFPTGAAFLNIEDITEKINRLRGMSACEIACLLHKQYYRNYGKLAQFVRWDQYPAPILCEMIHTMTDAFQGTNSLCCILKSFAKDYYNCSIGLPDITIWKPAMCRCCPFGMVGDCQGNVHEGVGTRVSPSIFGSMYGCDNQEREAIRQWSWRGLEDPVPGTFTVPKENSSDDGNSRFGWTSGNSRRRYCFYMVEVKDASTDRPSPQQHAWFERLHQSGASSVVGVCWVHSQ
eukprot:gb/GECG01002697.1/.p1 GENE.gb/GECG01002697.1/~~gb/GECG01002697.1/.p1  ORF type:complete len:978 (+),score=77.34 gb/GECG01002697.1/:1-2934(+)